MYKRMLALLTTNGKTDLVLASLFFTLYGLSSIAILIIGFDIIFKVIEGTTLDVLYLRFASIILLVVLKGIFNVIADFKKHGAGFDIVSQIREKMILKLKRFSLGFFVNERLGEINTILHKDVDNMSLVVGHMWPRMFADFLIAFTVLTGFLITDVKLSLIMIAPVPLAIVFLILTIKKSQEIENKNSRSMIDMVSLFVEYVRGIPVLKSFSNSHLLDDELRERVMRFGDTSKASSKFKAKQLSVFGFILDAGYFILLAVCAVFALAGYIDIYKLIVFAIISKEFYKPFINLEQHYMYYVSASDSYGRLRKILDAEEIPDKADGIVPEKNDIEFENVDFSYEKDNFELNTISFSIPEKTMTALVGASGSGKTTITNLLLRFYDVKRGSISLGGTDIRNIPYDELLDRISIVMQNVQLFNKTIEENLRVGKRNADREEIIEAAKKARIHGYIMSLPDGYDTDIGENGALLSGGQRQRLSIARAFLKDSPIVILDEMTSNVDPVNESLIQDAISELAKDRTVIVIAHHLKTIKNADQILVFNDGTLCERGRHEELLELKGLYRNLWEAQYVT